MKKLGFGFMRLPVLDPNDMTTIDYTQVCEMVDYYMDHGFTYFDTAWMYHDFASEKMVKKAVVDRYDRNKFTVASKMPIAMMKGAEDAPKIFEKQKENIGIDYFDYYLLHDMTYSKYLKAEEWGTIEYLKKKKESGEIKELGFSIHDNAENLDKILTAHPEFDFVQLQINYLDWDNPGVQSRLVYEVAKKHHKPVTVMEPIKGGTLIKLPEEAEQIFRTIHPDWSNAQWAIKFVASLENVRFVLSGMSDMSQLKDNVNYMDDFTPLTDEEKEAILKVRDIMNSWFEIPCTGCRYCVETNHCPKNILIPNYFALYNAEKQDQNFNDKKWTPQFEYYGNFVTQGYGKASDCIGCHMCEKVCPQHIHITEWLPKVANEFENK